MMNTLIGRTLSHYRIVEKIGAGGMGEVYRAHDSRLGRDVAIKVIPAELSREPDRIKRFEHEARAAGALNHPNVCAIYDVGNHEGTPYVVMELLEGQSLRDRIASGPIPLRKALDYAAQVAHGLAAAHEKGIVHRDLKPANLFVSKSGLVKVLDFGLAKLTRPEIVAPVGETTESVLATETGALLGTVGYMSPEQVRGHAADHRSDIFALGAVLYELLTGKRAFQGATSVETLSAILNLEPPPLAAAGREIAPSVESIVRHCLEKNPGERFQAAKDLAFDLENTGTNSALTNVAGGVARPPGKQRQALLPVLIATAALTSAAVLAGHLLWKPPQPPQPTYRQLTFQRGLVPSARFTADGKSVVYSANWEGKPAQVYEVGIDLSSTRDLNLPGMGLWGVSRLNTLAVGSDMKGADGGTYRTLSVVPLAGGAQRSLLENVSVADWSPDGKTLAVVRRVAGEDQIEMPPGHVLARFAGYVAHLRVSRDGRMVAFAVNPIFGDTRGTISVVDGSGAVRVLTSEYEDIWGVAWAASGREIWFCAAGWGEGRSALRAVGLDGRQRVVLRGPTKLRLRDISPDGRVLLTSVVMQRGIRGKRAQDQEERELGWLESSAVTDISRDGDRLLLVEQGASGGGSYSTYLRPMDGSAAVRLGEGEGASLSPDGHQVLMIRHGNPTRLMLIPTGAGEEVTLVSSPIERLENQTEWLPDGKGVVFVGSQRGQPNRTYVQYLDGGMPTEIASPGVGNQVISPDGRWVAANSSGRLVLYPLLGGEARVVSPLQSRDEVSQWSADGRFLYVGPEGTQRVVSRINIETGRREHWKTFELPDPAGSEIEDLVLTSDGRSYAYSYFRALHTLFLVEGLK